VDPKAGLDFMKEKKLSYESLQSRCERNGEELNAVLKGNQTPVAKSKASYY
jgi:hypothetical protein